MTSATKVFFLLLCFTLAHFVYSQSRYKNRVITRYDLSPRNRRDHRVIERKGDCPYNICSDVTGYPEESVKALIEKNTPVHSYFGNVIEPVNVSVPVASRINNDELPEPLCATIDQTIIPKTMLDVKKIDRVIANVKEYVQVIKIQTCTTNFEDECFKGGLLTHRTRCMQKYHVIKLLTVDSEKNILEYQSFEVPSTCVCTFVKSF